MRISLAAAIALLCFGSSEARAQTTARDSLVLRALSRFEEGDRIRVALLRSPFVGAYMGTRGDTVFFGKPNEPPMAFRFNAVDSLWRVGRRTRSGAIAGMMIGLLAAVASRDAATIGAAGAGGAALGAFVGSRFRRWRLVYGNPSPLGL